MQEQTYTEYTSLVAQKHDLDAVMNRLRRMLTRHDSFMGKVTKNELKTALTIIENNYHIVLMELRR